MPQDLLVALDEVKLRFSPADAARVLELLDLLAQQQFPDAPLLIRFHEALLFIRAYPHNEIVMQRAEELLASMPRRVTELRAASADISEMDSAETSGIAGTVTEEIFSFDIISWLLRQYPGKLRIMWNDYEAAARMAATWPRFLPLLEEESLVEANVPYRNWLDAARGHQDELAWLVARYQELPLSPREKAELYDALELPIQWELADASATRTLNRHSAPEIFFQREPLLRRGEVSLERELSRDSMPVRTLSRADGETVLDAARAGMAVRHRELYAFTHGDPEHVLAVDAGRGVEIFLCSLPPERRLPLRTYSGFVIYKNGVQVGYGDLVTLFDRTEIAFNHYYTFRHGESAWLYAACMRMVRQLFGVTAFSVDPYQIGMHNEEAIMSGAFWFYRKLGFRPLRPDLARLVAAEEKRIRATPGYRTSARKLRRIASGHILYEAPGADLGAWDRFHIRHLMLAAVRHLTELADLKGSSPASAQAEEIAVTLDLNNATLSVNERRAFANLAPVLALIADLPDWHREDKAALVEVIRAKAGADELRYAQLARQHPRLRQAVLELGSTPAVLPKRKTAVRG